MTGFTITNTFDHTDGVGDSLHVSFDSDGDAMVRTDGGVLVHLDKDAVRRLALVLVQSLGGAA